MDVKDHQYIFKTRMDGVRRGIYNTCIHNTNMSFVHFFVIYAAAPHLTPPDLAQQDLGTGTYGTLPIHARHPPWHNNDADADGRGRTDVCWYYIHLGKRNFFRPFLLSLRPRTLKQNKQL